MSMTASLSTQNLSLKISKADSAEIKDISAGNCLGSYS